VQPEVLSVWLFIRDKYCAAAAVYRKIVVNCFCCQVRRSPPSSQRCSFSPLLSLAAELRKMVPDNADVNDDLEQSLKDWEDLSAEYSDLEDLHKLYRNKMDEALSLQKKCVSGVKHQRYRLSAIQKHLSDVKGHDITEEQHNAKADLNKDILRRKAQLSQIEDYLPKPSGTYLKVILGSVNVSILDKQAKYQYKEQYERFKLIVVLIGCVLSITNLYANNRILDLLFLFLIVWYYCTLTIRESILKVNGSKIKGWWRAHHFISTALGGVLLVWPDGPCYQAFRNQLMWFNIYLAFLSYLQFTYQRGCLYRLKSLGLRNNEMDITIDGFHSWMWKGMSFLLPFLAVGYIWQLYHSYVLYHMAKTMESATWQVSCLSFLFFVLGAGNILAISQTIFSKIRETQLGHYKHRFTRLDKYFWTHKRQRNPELQRRYSIGAERIARKRSESGHSIETIMEQLEEPLVSAAAAEVTSSSKAPLMESLVAAATNPPPQEELETSVNSESDKKED